MIQLSNRSDGIEFSRLLGAEKNFKVSIANDGYYQAHQIISTVHRFLTTGTTGWVVNSGKVVLNEHAIVKIILDGHGSVILRNLAESSVANSLHIRFHICLLVNIAFFSNEKYDHYEYHRYLQALRRAALSIFSLKVYTPRHLEDFIIAASKMGTHVKWSGCFGSSVASWYLTKSASELKQLVFLWPMSRNITHSEILKKCSQNFKQLDIKEDVKNVIEMLAANSFYNQESSLNGNLSDFLPLGTIIPNLWNIRIANSLTMSDKVRVEQYMSKESYCENASVLEALLVLKKYEANHNRLDLNMTGFLRGVYRVLCDTETYFGVNVAVIPCVFKKESRSFQRGVLLQHEDLSAALLEDLMRNNRSKMYMVNKKSSNMTPKFYFRCDLPNNVKMFNVQNMCRYNPIDVLTKATVCKEQFDCFVIVCITNNSLDIPKIYDAIGKYRRLVNSWTKLIIVAVDQLNIKNSFEHFDNVLFVSGVNEGTAASLWDYMKRKYPF